MTRLTRDEFFAQIRARSKDMVERWIADAEAAPIGVCPDFFEVGLRYDITMHFTAEPHVVRKPGEAQAS